ncbi:hypothetical protein ABPG75_005572 [Micractinium tetrahymenae]
MSRHPAAIILLLLALTTRRTATDYADVSVLNSTPYPAWGTVHYSGAPGDSYDIEQPYGTWSHSRGGYLITEISGYVHTPKQNPVVCDP